MKRLLGSLVLVTVVSCIGWTQNAATDAPADKEDVQKLFATLHLREMMQNVMNATIQQQKQLTYDALKKKGIGADELKRMDAFLADFMKSIDVNGMLDDMLPVYQRHLTKQDVNAMLAFYNTPTGQKLLRDQPAMMTEGMQAMQPRMQKMMSDLMDKVEHMAKEEAGKAGPPPAK